MTKLDALHERPIEGDEHGHLHQDWQTAPERIDLFLAVQLHGRLREFLPVGAVPIPQFHHFGLELAHFRHGPVRRGGQLKERSFDEQGQQHDGDTPVAHNAMDEIKQPEQRLGDEPQPTVVNGQLQSRRDGRYVLL